MLFYKIILIVVILALVYEIFSFFKEKKKFNTDFVRSILIDLFALVFCLSKIFPDISWL